VYAQSDEVKLDGWLLYVRLYVVDHGRRRGWSGGGDRWRAAVGTVLPGVGSGRGGYEVWRKRGSKTSEYCRQAA